MKFNLQFFAMLDILDPTKSLKSQVKKQTNPNIDILDSTKSRPTTNKVAPRVPNIPKITAPTENNNQNLVRKSDGKVFGTYEEGVEFRRRQAEQDAARAQDEANRNVTGPVIPAKTTQVAEAEPQVDTADQLRKRREAMLVRNFQNAMSARTRQAETERAQLTPAFRQARTDVETRNVMDLAGAEKLAQVRGEGQAGSLGQTELGLNVAKQGALTGLNQQELQARADIERRLTEDKMKLEQGLLNAQEEADIQLLEAEIRSQEAQAEYERERADLLESREYDEYIRQVENADERELLAFKQQLVERNKEIDFQIKEAQSTNDFAREMELTKQKADNDARLEGIRQYGRIQLEERRTANTLTEIEARGTQDRLTDTEQARLRGDEVQEEERFEDNVFEDGAKTLLGNFNQFTSEAVKQEALTEYLFDQILAGNLTTDEQIARLETRFNLSPGTIERKLDAIEEQNKINDTPGVGGLGLN